MALPRRRGLTEQASDAAIDPACRLLRLPPIRHEFNDIADRAVKDQMTYRGFLAELLFRVLPEREEKNSVAIASNESFGDWTKTFTDPRLCAAIVDRLTFNGTIPKTGTDSYHLTSTRAGAEETAAAS
ncbi:ATP-binding protein [Streptomyces sp. NBC_00439]|uniref:ATP-binding protein n=1 Tax=unclassified Streptomyces TaxID=2593676 RepID=UPI00225194C2|nr:ATP-binding protein [Streptomyces sp. NBC_00439]MCX5098347.1 ATP-binding protein [Streptomyces sp. NBC_00439]